MPIPLQAAEPASAVVPPPLPRWRLAVTAGVLGWVLDAFDFFVVVFLFDTLAAEFHTSKAAVVYTLTLTLLMRPLGAFAFGAMADRFGRRIPLVVCVLYFSSVTVLSGLAPTIGIFALLRALYGFGMGGYWGIGASYAMELAPVRLRGLLSGAMQAGYPFGYLLAAVAMQVLTPHFGPRSVFFVGFPVACLIALLTLFAPESRAWKADRPGSTREMLSPIVTHRGMFAYLLVLMSIMLCLSHGTQDLYPDFLRSLGPAITGHKLFGGLSLVYGLPIAYNMAAIVGSLAFGQLSERVGRRYACIAAVVLCLLSIPMWAFGATVAALLAGSCMMQAGAQGAFGVIPAHINELSPSNVRGLFPGFVYQLGVLFAAPATMVEHALKDRIGYPWALTTFEAAVVVMLLGLYAFGPEARGRSFEKA